jgi:putative peptidoglycan lipid II flippase
LFSLLISIVSFVNQVFIANYFGASASLDLYLKTSALPTLLGGIVSLALSYSFIPHLLSFKSSKPFPQYIEHVTVFIKQLIKCYIIIALCTWGLTLLLNTDSLFANYYFQLTFFAWLTSLFTVLTGVCSSLLNVEHKFLTSAALNVFPYLGSIFFICIFHLPLNILSVSIGLVIGTVISAVVGIKLLPYKLKWRNKYKDEEVKTFLKRLPLIAIAVLCFSVFQSIDAFWAPQLGVSSLSYLSYCQRVLIAFGALIISGPSAVLVPHLSALLQRSGKADFYLAVLKLVKITILLAALSAVVLSSIAKPIIVLMFQRGAFTTKDSDAVAAILPFMFTGMVFMLSVVILYRICFLLEISSRLVVIGIATALLYFSLSGIGAYFFKLKGITGAYILTWVAIWTALMGLIFKNLNRHLFFSRENYLFAAKSISLISITALVCFCINTKSPFLFSNVFLQSLTTIVCTVVPAILVIIAGIRILNITELIQLLRQTPLKILFADNAK